MTPTSAVDWRGRWTLGAVLTVALALRLAAIFLFPSLHHPDEAFQLFEPAHRLAFGWGVKTWEFTDGIRSMVAPAVLAGIFRLAEPVVGGPQGYIDAARIACALLSMLPIVFIWRMGERESRIHAFLAALVAASWFEIVYFSIRPLTEALACDFALTALALASPPARVLTPRALAGVGLCLALTVLLRLQLAPGAALVALAVGRLQVRRRWVPMLAGALPALIVFGAVDWLTWRAPFVSYWRAVTINIGFSKASLYGVLPTFWYYQLLYSLWTPFISVIAGFCLIRISKSFLWIGFAIVELLCHQFIPHKEYRFIYPAFVSLIIAASLGSADIVVYLTTRLRLVRASWLAAVASVAWLTSSLSLAAEPDYRGEWFAERGLVEATYWLAEKPNVCGVLQYDWHWWNFPGYAFLHRRVPVYMPVYFPVAIGDGTLIDPPGNSRGTVRGAAVAYNVVVLKPSSIVEFGRPWRLARCFGSAPEDSACVIVRSGWCRTVSNLRPILDQVRIGEPRPVKR